MIKNGCSEQVSILLDDVKHQLSVEFPAEAQDFFLSLYAKIQRHVRFRLKQRALYETTGGENDFIFIHLPWAHSSDTGNRALSIRYWLVLIHYPCISLCSHLCWLSCKNLAPDRPHQNSRAYPANRKSLGCPSAYHAFLRYFSFSTPKKHYQFSIIMWK